MWRSHTFSLSVWGIVSLRRLNSICLTLWDTLYRYMERSIQLLDRAIAILHACEEGPASLNDVAARTGLPRATAHRLAVALEDHGLLRRVDGRFALGPTLARLGAVASSGPTLVVAARPALEDLRDATGESVQLYVRRG